ncbi:MAG TPA: trypsin-like peptidase domain-containing protein [Acetobacteraceae bacterium]|nr:trypsin-like peptidase domain-containing protein [Acetobacteraceae bacterium]
MDKRVRAALFAGALFLTGCTAASSQAQGQSGVSFRGAPPSFAPLVKAVVPAVVNIQVIEGQSEAVAIPPELRGTPAERLLRERLRRRAVLGAGSGFIIDPSGVIVTNTHVVGRASRITVSLSDGRELPARLIGSDELTDLAVIQVKSDSPLPYVSWGDSKVVEVGDWILAAGNPFGVGTSVTAGIVSARGRDIGAGPFDDFLQIDAPINPGNSGGPTFNMNGEVVAVNTAIVSPTGGSVGIGFAVPSEIASHIVDDLRTRGRIDRGWLGVSVQGGERGQGVAVAGVERAGPAARAGLRPGDVILAVNGQRVESTQGLIRTIAAIPPGRSAQLQVRRGGQTIEVPVTVGRRPAEPQE